MTNNEKFEILLKAIERIADWPDGGNEYGQVHIKRYAANVIKEIRDSGPGESP